MNFIKLSLNLISIIFLSHQISCIPTFDHKYVLDYFETFGYLNEEEKFELSSLKNDVLSEQKIFIRAVKNYQENGNLEITGRLDRDTLKKMKSLRCGVPDKIYSGRKKRYALMSTKWHDTTISWSYHPKNELFTDDEMKIRSLINEAFKAWQEHSVLTFKEVYPASDDVDIRLSFEMQNHKHVDPFPFGDNTLGHAFQPGRDSQGLGGDAHFRDNIDWDFDVITEEPAEDKTSFFAVILHEIGHSLGLAHSKVADSVMYEYYSVETATLTIDDIKGIQFIYGQPQNRKYRPSTGKTTNVPQTSDYDENNPIWGTRPIVNTTVAVIPDKCNTSYDAIATIRDELFMFKGKYMFRPDSTDGEPVEIRRFWSELPENLSHVDAVYENSEGKILIFIGTRVFIFNTNRLESEMHLNHFRIDGVKKIDAMFKWHYNKRTYIFSDDLYWRFDEKTNMVEKNFPKEISKAFRDVYDINTAFDYNNQLYFFKNEYYYEFDSYEMRMKRMTPQLSANKFMKCNIHVAFKTRFGNGEKDYIDLGDDFFDKVEDKSNDEKLAKMLSGNDAGSIKCISIISFIIILLTSQIFI